MKWFIAVVLTALTASAALVGTGAASVSNDASKNRGDVAGLAGYRHCLGPGDAVVFRP
jgi:hypothetical protein